MSYKDTLTLYNELKSCGISEQQAQLQAKQLGEISQEQTNQLGKVNNVMDEIRQELKEIRQSISWMRLIGAAMTIAFFSNIVMCKL